MAFLFKPLVSRDENPSLILVIASASICFVSGGSLLTTEIVGINRSNCPWYMRMRAGCNGRASLVSRQINARDLRKFGILIRVFSALAELRDHKAQRSLVEAVGLRLGVDIAHVSRKRVLFLLEAQDAINDRAQLCCA